MSKLTSNWKLTFDPTGTPKVILNYDNKMEGELKFSLKNGLEVIPTPDSAWPLLLATGNSAVNIRFALYTDSALDKDSRAAVLNSLISVASLGVKPLRIEVSGYTDRYWQFASCMIAEHDPARYLEAPVARMVRGYTLTCAGLDYVP